MIIALTIMSQGSIKNILPQCNINFNGRISHYIEILFDKVIKQTSNHEIF